MNSNASTVDEYLDSLPAERREALLEVRAAILAGLPTGYEEGMLFGMIAYYVPLSRYPKTKDKKPLLYAALASQKNYMAAYLKVETRDDPTGEWFRSEYAATGKKLDMGRSCVRFRALNDLPLPLVTKAISQWPVDRLIEAYESSG